VAPPVLAWLVKNSDGFILVDKRAFPVGVLTLTFVPAETRHPKTGKQPAVRDLVEVKAVSSVPICTIGPVDSDGRC